MKGLLAGLGLSNLSLSLCNEHHYPNSLQLTNGKDATKQHFCEGIEEAYYLVKETMMC
jgi:hypothetical protein